jgi:putative peptidoglycan lipid II flippase
MTNSAVATRGLIVRATVLTTGLTVLGSMLGLLRDLLLARFFGATADTDAFLVAWTVPETATPLLIDGAMAFLMVPIFVRALAQDTSFAAVVRATLPRILVLLTIGSAVIAIGAPVLVHSLAPGLDDPALAVRCTRITAITVLTFGVTGYLSAALRSLHRFGWAASIYVAYNVGILTIMTLLHGRLGAVSAAIGVALGSVLMVAVQLPRFLLALRPGGGMVAPPPQVALGAFIPIAGFVLARHAQVFVERFLGSQLSAGTISHLNYAQKVAQVPMTLSVLLAVVTFPMLARSVVSGDETGSSNRAEWDLRLVSAVVLAASAYLVAFAQPIIATLFQHGEFTAADTAATAAIMRLYCLGLPAQAVVAVISRSFFTERQPTWYPALAMAAGLITTAVVAAALLPVWHGPAIAAGNAVGITVGAGLLLTGQRGTTAAVDPGKVARSVLRLVVPAGVAGVVGWLACRSMGNLPAPVVAGCGLLVVSGAFVLLCIVTGAEEARWVGALVRGKRHAT